MSQKTVQTNQNNYDPASMSTYQRMQAGIGSTLNSYMNNPYSSGLYNLRLQQSVGQANQLGQRAVSNVTQNATAGGFGGGNMGAFNQSMLASAGRQQSGQVAGAYQNALLGAQQLQLQATQQAQGYNPLQTGQTQTQTKSGLGTWLPQVAGMAIQAGMGAMTGGASLAAKAGSSAASAGMNIGANSFNQFAGMTPSPFNGMAGAGQHFAGGFGMPAGFGGPQPAGPGFGYGMPNPFNPGGR